jgi:hypothetical protein
MTPTDRGLVYGEVGGETIVDSEAVDILDSSTVGNVELVRGRNTTETGLNSLVSKHPSCESREHQRGSRPSVLSQGRIDDDDQLLLTSHTFEQSEVSFAYRPVEPNGEAEIVVGVSGSIHRTQRALIVHSPVLSVNITHPTKSLHALIATFIISAQIPIAASPRHSPCMDAASVACGFRNTASLNTDRHLSAGIKSGLISTQIYVRAHSPMGH